MAILKNISKIFGNSDEKAVTKLHPIVEQINGFETVIKTLTDSELYSKTEEFRARVSNGESIDSILPEAFAVVRETAFRVLGQRHYDVQLIGGIVLHQGKIAEMRTGEGKTLVATLPAYLNSLTGNGVHVVTVNDYLARRDAEWMGQIYSQLGLTVGVLQNNDALLFQDSGAMESVHRSQAYGADITYGTNHEFGFDFLRDNMAESLEAKVQHKRSFAIVDEVDNILIDEARTPLIISGPSEQNPNEYVKFAKIAPSLQENEDYTVDEKLRSVSLSGTGIAKIEKLLGVKNLYDPEYFGQVHFIENAVRAEVVYQRDRDYVVRSREVLIVDEFTGRIMEGRRFSDGMHQALEAKEKVNIQRESITYATITLQNYFRLYDKLSGMTGTAVTESEEFWKIYQLEVLSIPTNQPIDRNDLGDLIFRDQQTKYKAVVEEISSRIAKNQPVLVGTTDIDKSEIISKLLKREGIKHEVLNAKQHDREATIIAQAGRPGAVTVATNMAGRGTDIVLGGSKEEEDDDSDWELRNKTVLEAGGLCIIGTERHEARRIDNQLRGRSGRQGDPGETRFYVGLDDDLVRRFGGDRIKSILDWAGMDDDSPIENKMISKSIENAQVKVEAFHFDMRKHLVEYDDVVNTQRDLIYGQREKVINGAEISDQIREMLRAECVAIIENAMSGPRREEWDVDGMLAGLSSLIPLTAELGDRERILSTEYQNYADSTLDYLDSIYVSFEENLGHDNAREIERFFMLRSIDTNWVQHL
ncbi:MAG: preprotein translocase subunit SecA, partial [SAR202 cluster bacterium]|nr:preprotein translocase subunit SecA [SAR202 cluster bacterium]